MEHTCRYLFKRFQAIVDFGVLKCEKKLTDYISRNVLDFS